MCNIKPTTVKPKMKPNSNCSVNNANVRPIPAINEQMKIKHDKHLTNKLSFITSNSVGYFILSIHITPILSGK